MIRRPPRSTRTDTLFPYTTLFRSLDTTITTSKCSRYTFRPFDFAPSQAVAIAPHLVNKVGKKWHIAYADYRSEEHTSELQSLMRISYAVFCLKKKKTPNKLYDYYKTLMKMTVELHKNDHDVV